MRLQTMMSLRLILSMFAFCLVLSGCAFLQDDMPSSAPVETNMVEDFISKEEMLAYPDLLAIVWQNQLTLVAPEAGELLPLMELAPSQYPVRSRLHDIKISKTKEHIVWYTPQEGILVYHIPEGKLESVFAPNSWLNSNPYFVLTGDGMHVFSLIDDGNTLQRVHLDTKETTTYEVPYPYGTVFRLSPSGKRALFISDLRQEEGRPAYLIMDLENSEYEGIALDIDVADRYLVEWTNDESGFVAARDNELLYVPFSNPTSRRQIMQIDGKQILRIESLDDSLYVFDDEGYWHVYSFSENKEVARTPITIAQELRQPTFFPWYDKSFLITEIAGDAEDRYQRLWRSDLRGNKHLVVPSFGRVHFENDIPIQ